MHGIFLTIIVKGNKHKYRNCVCVRERETERCKGEIEEQRVSEKENREGQIQREAAR